MKEEDAGPSNRELYALLNISPDASDEEIRKAYRQFAQVYHPDKYQPHKARPFLALFDWLISFSCLNWCVFMSSEIGVECSMGHVVSAKFLFGLLQLWLSQPIYMIWRYNEKCLGKENGKGEEDKLFRGFCYSMLNQTGEIEVTNLNYSVVSEILPKDHFWHQNNWSNHSIGFVNCKVFDLPLPNLALPRSLYFCGPVIKKF